MASVNNLRFYIKYAANFHFLRSSKCSPYLKHMISHSKSTFTKNDDPVKFTATNASKISINESLELTDSQKSLWYQPIIIVGSLIVFLIYFCILREENDIDEKIKGNPDFLSDYSNYINLKLKLEYCHQNNIPATSLEKKIAEYEAQFNIK